jgi:hypothetical protein
VVSAKVSGRRATLEAMPSTDLAGGPGTIPGGDLFSGVVSDITGRVITTGLQADMRSAERQTELDQRLIPGIPSDFQVGYLVLVVLGLFGVPVSRAWWRRIWPPETASEYAGRAGYLAARTVRALVPAAVPAGDGTGQRAVNLARQVYEAVTAPLRWWRRLTGGRAAAPSAS